MRAPPPDLDPPDLVRALAHWDLHEPRLEHLPVGFGSHHWRAETPGGRHAFVTVDEASDALERAFRTANALRDAGLEFVLAPIPDRSGALIHRVGGRYAVSVTPFVEGSSASFGDYETKDERRRVAELVARIHSAGGIVPADVPRRDDLTIPFRPILDEALARVALPWSTGPFAEPARTLLATRADEIRRSLLAHDGRAERLLRRSDAWVVTHGEPHRANLIVDATGALYLVDWETTLVAPRERDLWQVLDDELAGWDEYRAVAGDVELDVEALQHYRERWDLADIAAFVADVRRPHEDDENTAASFGYLREYLSG